jgi:hypothetical protein
MKDLHGVIAPTAIQQYVMGEWKTDLFRNSHQEGGFVGQLVAEFARVPRLFARTTNDQLERSHFSTWWNVIMLRDDYSNPVVSDLYYLHEMYHAARMPYVPGIGKVAFNEKMQRNELEASAFSEIEVYFAMPGLRDMSFPHEIYADRFLSDPYMQALYRSNPRVAMETVRTIRRDVMMSKPEHLLDTTELWIRRFAEQNDAYALAWSENYGLVEQTMWEFHVSAALDPRHAINWFLLRVEEWAREDPVDGVPFRQEAELFSPFYWANKARYDRAMKTGA